MKTVISLLLGFLSVMSMLSWVSLLLGNSTFADISSDTQLETQWYGPSTPNAYISAIPDPAPIPVSISINITQTRDSH